MNRQILPTLFAVGLALAGCQGEVSLTPQGDRPGGTQNTNNGSTNGNNGLNGPDFKFACDEDAELPEIPLRRLSKEQYMFTVQDLLRQVVPNQADQIYAAALPRVSLIPEDAPQLDGNNKHGGFRRLDQAIQQQFVDHTLEAATVIGTQVSESAANLEAMLGTCATDSDTANDDACIVDFIESFGQLALRRPVTSDDIAFYQSVYADSGISTAGVRDMIAVMLSSPDFLYQVESAADGVDGKPNQYNLDTFELANRLAFHFWQSMPDSELMAKAADGTLSDPAVYEAEVKRIFEDPKTNRSVQRFVTEWLWLDELPEMNGLVGTPLYDAFAGEDSPSDDLKEDMVADVVSAGSYYFQENPGSFDDFFMSQKSFARSAELAKIYDTPIWDGGSEPPTFSDPTRVGLFTRAAFLATGVVNTRPIMKGVFIREGLLCTIPPPPDANAVNTMIDLRPDMTTREVVEEITEAPGTSCAGCHLTYINGLGFPTENYDALGRSRTHQTLFDLDGNILGTKEVNTLSHPRVPLDTIHEVSSGAELTPVLIDSGQLYSCFARNYVRFTFARVENDQKDGCVLETVRSLAQSGATLPEVMISLALRPEFKQRTLLENP